MLQNKHHSLVGSTKDPEHPREVALTVFAAVVVYAVRAYFFSLAISLQLPPPSHFQQYTNRETPQIQPLQQTERNIPGSSPVCVLYGFENRTNAFLPGVLRFLRCTGFSKRSRAQERSHIAELETGEGGGGSFFSGAFARVGIFEVFKRFFVISLLPLLYRKGRGRHSISTLRRKKPVRLFLFLLSFPYLFLHDYGARTRSWGI